MPSASFLALLLANAFSVRYPTGGIVGSWRDTVAVCSRGVREEGEGVRHPLSLTLQYGEQCRPQGAQSVVGCVLIY